MKISLKIVDKKKTKYIYEKCLAPLVNRLDSLSDLAKPQMTDAEVDAFSDDDLSALVNVKFEVARRRHRWLEERIVRRK